MKRKFETLFRRLFGPRRPTRHPDFKPYGKTDNLEIEFAFNCNGKDYFRAKDVTLFGARRIQEYEIRRIEYLMGVDEAFLDYFSEELDKQLNPKDGVIRAGVIADLHNEMKARRLAIRPARAMYHLASVYFFDLEEDLTTYNIQYNNEKIDGWHESETVGAFFLKKPMKELFGLSAKSAGSLTRKIKAGEILRNTKRAIYSRSSTTA